ncbi:hypothetical protein D9V84_10460 [Bacteroidetes/Chlorobi group bacterium Naka2016]|jgi:putative DNA primase/helicase|nr:MAG: hypothetical protein D9V84_10460 [Bacteroidetes/Chlorobi group bacterium Naka2016]
MELKRIFGYLEHGLSIIPIIKGSKRPAINWKEYQERHPTSDEIRKWFTNRQFDVALVAGRVSGNLEIIDIDNHQGDADKIFWEWKEIVNNTIPNLFEKLLIQKSQSGGFHIIYRADCTIPGNTRLASRKIDGKVDTFIETRGEGGYALIFPSNNYEILQGSFSKIPLLSKEERNVLIAICRSFNQDAAESTPKKEYIENSKDGRPGDIFNRQGDIKRILERHGWTLVRQIGEKEFWRRPGKEGREWSATFNFIPNKFYVFSSNAKPFEPFHCYDKFSVYTLLEHNGDFRAAAKELANMGYSGNGKPKRIEQILGKEKIMTNGNLPPLTEVGNAQRFKKIFEKKLKYNHSSKEWLIWDGIRWRADTKDNIRLLGKSISESIEKDEPLYVAAGYDQKAVRSWHKSSQTLRNIDASLKLAACDPAFATENFNWDTDPYLVNFKNGTLDLRDIKFYKNRPEDMITKLIPYEFDPKATSPLWDEALNMYFEGKKDLIEFVQKCCGLSLCGAHLEEIILFLYGTGANGKSIFINTLRSVFGEYAGLLPIEALITQRFDDTKKSEIASLVGTRLVVTTEIPVGKNLNEATVKMLTGGDAIKVRNLYQNFFTLEPTFTLWIFGNHKPEIRGADNGIWRRMALIPFEKTIPPEKRLPQSIILEKLKQEATGIISWIVEGWRKYSSEGLKRPEAVVAATENYKDDQDPLSGFFLDQIVIIPEGKEKGHDLYQSYLKWCENLKEFPIGKKVFFRILEEKGFSVLKDRKGQKIFFGLSLAENIQNIILQENEERIDEYDEPF